MAAVASINVSEDQVRQFLDTLLGRPPAAPPATAPGQPFDPAGAQSPYGGEPAPPPPPAQPQAPSPWLFGGQTAAAAGDDGSSSVALRLHPRIDAVHPLGEAHSSVELVNALKLYKQMLKDVHLEVDEVMVGPDKALVTGHQVISSHLASMLPQVSHGVLPLQLQHLASDFLPALSDGRVPTTIQLRFGKSDAGDPVVTQLSVTFSLLAVLLPHLALQPWQSQMLAQMQPHMLHALQSAGSLAAVLEDVGTTAGATWRTWAAVMQATLGKVLAELKERMSSAAAAARSRAAGDGGAVDVDVDAHL